MYETIIHPIYTLLNISMCYVTNIWQPHKNNDLLRKAPRPPHTHTLCISWIFWCLIFYRIHNALISYNFFELLSLSTDGIVGPWTLLGIIYKEKKALRFVQQLSPFQFNHLANEYLRSTVSIYIYYLATYLKLWSETYIMGTDIRCWRLFGAAILFFLGFCDCDTGISTN